MRALTLTQPWAGLVASSLKPDENRPRSMIKRVDFGVPFALHASREIVDGVYARIRELAPELQPVTNDWYRLSRITGAVIAVATIDDVHDLRTLDGMAWLRSLPPERARFVFGPIVYSLRDIRVIATPVPCRGYQGFWTLSADDEAAVRGQLPITEVEVVDALRAGAEERRLAERTVRSRPR